VVDHTPRVDHGSDDRLAHQGNADLEAFAQASW
jgi:hypothetical protein